MISIILAPASKKFKAGSVHTIAPCPCDLKNQFLINRFPKGYGQKLTIKISKAFI